MRHLLPSKLINLGVLTLFISFPTLPGGWIEIIKANVIKSVGRKGPLWRNNYQICSF